MRRRKLDVAFFMSSLGLTRGGMETQAIHLARGLVARGHCVTVVSGYRPAYRPPQLENGSSVRWLRVPSVPAQLPIWRRLSHRRPGLPLKLQSLSYVYLCRLHPHVRELIASADVTVTFLEVETVLVSAWRERHRQPNVSYFPGGIDWEWLRRDRSIVRVALSRTMAERYRDVPDFEIDGVIVPGVPERWLERPYRVRPKARRLIFVGRLESNKGIMELLSIFEGLVQEVPDLELTVLGDGPLRARVDARLARTGLSGRVRCPGSVPSDRVWQELRDADLFVFPSHYESLPMAILEAQAVGVPVVASDVAGIREAAGTTGRLLPPKDRDAWIAAIRSLLDDHAARKRMSLIARERARQFTWDRAVAELEKHLYLALARYAEKAGRVHADDG